ncbi:MAG TPA: undecaprenyl/decaprenyl-phosphate alpha-N-acetylglucosaminyl 1-phosphate transferase [Chromatiaceae bacterium]|nr:undecaprenyl/decaprenyl-phosphate alpha-N-acetylglucosaminyl 1-phosphate transferase [Chromatiaceae bacterium]
MLVSFTTCSVCLVALLPLAGRLGLIDHPGERRRVHREPVPKIGGLAIFVALLVSSLPFADLPLAQRYGLAGAALLVLVGAWDDRRPLKPRTRLVAQALAALLLTLGGGVTLTSLGDLFGHGPVLLGPLAIPFTVFAVVGIINAFNLVDGIDGLAAGLLLIALWPLLVLAPSWGPMQILLATAVAALIPFLLCNLRWLPFARCRVFLGDAGSLLLGYLVAWALIDATRSPAGLQPVTALWLVALPLADTLAVMGQRLVTGRSPFAADRRHLHHLLLRMFPGQRRVLVMVLALAGLLAALGLTGEYLGLAEAVRFAAALGVFGLYLLWRRSLPRLYHWQLGRHQHRQAPRVDLMGFRPQEDATPD